MASGVAPHGHQRLDPGSGTKREMLGVCGRLPLCSAYGNFPESGKFPAFPGSSPPSDTNSRSLTCGYAHPRSDGSTYSQVTGARVRVPLSDTTPLGMARCHQPEGDCAEARRSPIMSNRRLLEIRTRYAQQGGYGVLFGFGSC